MEMSKEQPNEPKESVKLAYIDNVYSTLNAFWALRSRLALAVGVLSVIFLAIAFGVLRPRKDTADFSFIVNLAGLELKIPLVWFLVAGAVVLAALVVAWYAVLFRVNSLYLEMIRLYRGLSYRDKAVCDPLTNPFHSATFYGALRAPNLSKRWPATRNGTKLRLGNGTKLRFVRFVKWYEWAVAHATTWLFVGLLPIGTEGVILWKLLKIVKWQEHWIVASGSTTLSVICFLFALGAWVSYFLKKPKGL
jgi:hypothetical protein